jgi:hypothetical protein
MDHRESLLCVIVCVFAQGPEGLLLDMSGLLGSINEGLKHTTPYVTAALLGKVKGETHRRHHEMHSVGVTSSGLEVRKVLGDLMWI